VIVFDLQCDAQAHVFEAWFGSSADFDSQRLRSLIACPFCGDTTVSKAVMAPNVGPKGNTLPVTTSHSLPVAMPNPEINAPQVKAMLAALAKAQAAVLENSTWVGRAFAGQARAMDAGEIEHASIYGEATSAEAQALREDGIGVMPLPIPVIPPDQRN